MAIKITSFIPQEGEARVINEPLSLQDDGVYWYLYPYFRNLYNRTGKMIDLYGIAQFAGDSLLELDSALDDLMKDVIAQPDEWDQKVGTRIKPEKRTLYDRITKRNVLATIKLLKNVTSEGIKNNAVIVFEGL